MTKDEIKAAVASMQGNRWDVKVSRYHQLASQWIKEGDYPENLYEQFSDSMMAGAEAFYGWGAKSPIWYHGGPNNLNIGDPLLRFPNVPSPRRGVVSNLRASIGLEATRPNYVYFTHDRTLAERYSWHHAGGQVYRVAPEGKIQIDPEAFLLSCILSSDPELNGSADKTFPAKILGYCPAWRAPSARILGLG